MVPYFEYSEYGMYGMIAVTDLAPYFFIQLTANKSSMIPSFMFLF